MPITKIKFTVIFLIGNTQIKLQSTSFIAYTLVFNYKKYAQCMMSLWNIDVCPSTPVLDLITFANLRVKEIIFYKDNTSYILVHLQQGWHDLLELFEPYLVQVGVSSAHIFLFVF